MKLRDVRMMSTCAALAGGKNVGRAGREIDHGRHPARRHQRKDGQGGAVGVRQHDAERTAFRRHRHQLGAEDGRTGEQLLVGERSGHRVFDRDAALAVGVGGL